METEVKKPKKLHYGWVICIANLLLIFMSLGVISNGFSIYLPFLIKEFNLTNAQNSSLMTARWITTFLSMLFVNKYYSKVSYRLGMTLACLMTALGHFIYSIATGYSMCIIGSLVMGFGYGLGSMIPATILVSRWFVKSRQLAMGISTTGSSLAVMILPLVLTKYIEKAGVQAAFRLETFALIITALIIFLITRDSPEMMGLKPYGYDPNETQEVKVKGNEDSKPLTTSMWIILLFAGLAMGAEANPLYSHITINYTSQGYDKMIAATMFSITGYVLFAAKLICGRIGDKQGGLKTAYLFGIIQISGYLLASLAGLHSTIINVLAIGLIGLGTPLPTMSVSLWATDLVSQKDYPKVVARMQIMYSLGSLCFSSVPGILADKFNGLYGPGFIAGCIVCLAGLVVITIGYIKMGVFKDAIRK